MILRLVCGAFLLAMLPSSSLFAQAHSTPTAAAPATPPVLSDESFLDEVQRTSWLFFDAERNPANGLVADRAKADGSRGGGTASIASVGFGLTAICIADSRSWLTRADAAQRVLTTLRYFHDHLPQKNGFFHHFYKMEDGTRADLSEVSPIDTALFLAGAIMAREYFALPEITKLVNDIYARVDWRWMLNGDRTLALAWSPEDGFLKYRWNGYSEHMVMYLLGMGSKTYPLPPDTWKAWQRFPIAKHFGYEYIECLPLFTHQYSQAFVDFRNKHDGVADYFLNSRYATLAQRKMCISLQERFPKWGPNMWGITASDSANGYIAWGGPPAAANLDGTVVPCAPGGSIPFAPEECIAALREMKDKYGDKIWKKYGFVDAFNPHTGWVDEDVIGIDVGITLVQIENQRSGLIWKYFMQAPEIQSAMKLAGFVDSNLPLTNSALVPKKVIAQGGDALPLPQ